MSVFLTRSPLHPSSIGPWLRGLRQMVAAGVLAGLAACGGGGGGGLSNLQSGTFLDSQVSGLSYTTDSRSGVTDANGRFSYLPGETVTFRLQGVYIGEAQGASVLTPSLITPAGAHADYSLNVLRLLQSLDTDHNPGNGITLGGWAVTQNINLNQATDAFAGSSEVTSLITQANTYQAGTSLVSAGAAMDHFASTVQGLSSGSAYVLDLSSRTVSSATMRISGCTAENAWTISFGAQTASISGNEINPGNCSNAAWTSSPIPYVSQGTSLWSNGLFVPCGPVCTLADLNQTYQYTDDHGQPFEAKVAHMAGTREIFVTKTASANNGRSAYTAYFRLILAP